MNSAVNIEDLKQLARQRVPRAIFDYIDGGSEAEVTLRDNRRVWDEVLFRPHQAVATPKVDLSTTVLGCKYSMPFLLAPVAFCRLFHPDGELAVARAAGDAGIGYCQPSFSGYRVEETGPVSKTPLWYQLYLTGGRKVVEATLDRVWRAGFKALAVTIDTNAPGMREKDVRNGTAQLMSGNLFKMLPHLGQVLARPTWLARFLLDYPDVMKFANVLIPGKGPMGAVDVRQALTDSVVTWEDMRWIRKAWPGPVLAKGVLSGHDARRAMDEGCAGVIVSNHGGRQLDTCYPTLRALPEVVDAVNGRVEVLVDGGIRRGGDILKALCMGANAVLVGRAYAYGLAGSGYPGVVKAISILKADLERTMILLGCASLKDLNSSFVDVPRSWDHR